jgi:NAD(P)-dependent dehydrogenase (short-subunit alcohol dehydrogenase family)/rhamnose utilization protein RhaD (predicted bifunctional aldolase and dehydrogenase)
MSDTNKCPIQILADMSNKYGAKAEFVLAGGGNTSYKDETTLYIKGSGTALATIKPEEFVKMDRVSLEQMWDKTYSADESEREAQVLSDMMDSRVKGETRRPSVETLLHDLFPQKYVLHVHPAKVNGLTCSVGGETEMKKLFPDAVWIPVCKPGYILALSCRDRIAKRMANNGGGYPNLLFLENHGVFFAADTTEEIDVLAENVMSALNAKIGCESDTEITDFDVKKAVSLAPAIRMFYGEGKPATVKFNTGAAVLAFDPYIKSYSPDHIVYYKAEILVAENDVTAEELQTAFCAFTAAHGYKPKIIYVKALGYFSCGANYKEAATAESVFLDAVKIYAYAKAFGGSKPMPDDLIDFIVNWEVESYRTKVSLAGTQPKRLENKIAIVTGAAQGFGLGIAQEIAKEGAYVVIADMNCEGAQKAAESIPNSLAVAVNVTDEKSVEAMIEKTVLTYGGLDLLVSNAGVVKAGSLEEMQKSAFEFVTSVNYTGYFLCVKYASVPMMITHKFAPDYMMDIIEINSKSGLAGSNKNFAYAGSKFGGIGLTQSFALELAEYKIKVNAVCPGNFLDGPLWSDPVNGLFVQYLKAGKVAGAKTVEDVRKSYESKVPLGRGCEVMDVVRAIYYITEQTYETGQAVPVTGGQEMLK